MSSSHYDLITVWRVGTAASGLGEVDGRKRREGAGSRAGDALPRSHPRRVHDAVGRGRNRRSRNLRTPLQKRQSAQKIPWIDLGMGGPPREFTTTTPQQQPGMGYSHPEMQEALLTATECSGAEVRRGVTVQGVEPGSPAFVIATSGKEFGANFGAARGGRGRTQFANAKMGGVPTDKRASSIFTLRRKF